MLCRSILRQTSRNSFSAVHSSSFSSSLLRVSSFSYLPSSFCSTSGLVTSSISSAHSDSFSTKSSSKMSTGSSNINPDPRDQYPKPPFKDAQEQKWPGSEEQMNPKADWGQDTYKGSDKLKGQVALITGGDSGIGRAVAVAFSREGADIAISYLPVEEQDAQGTKAFVEKAGRKCVLIPGNLEDKSYCSEIVEKTVKELGRIDILVNNAAQQGKAVESFMDLDYERVSTAFKINIISFFETTRAALKHMKPGACIINTGSIQAYSPTAKILDYACTKGAIVAFTKGLAQELTEKGIRVNCVAPGPVWTPLVAASFPTDKLKTFGEKYPMGRPGQPAELAPAYVFLASGGASFVTGEVLGVTGGGILG